MTPVVKLTRALTDQHLARIGDPELVAKVAAERAAVDTLLAQAQGTAATIARLLCSKAEVCEMLDLSPRAVEQRVADGTFPPECVIRIGRRIRFDVAKLLDALRGKAEAKAESRGASWARRRASLKVVDGGAP